MNTVKRLMTNLGYGLAGAILVVFLGSIVYQLIEFFQVANGIVIYFLIGGGAILGLVSRGGYNLGKNRTKQEQYDEARKRAGHS